MLCTVRRFGSCCSMCCTSRSSKSCFGVHLEEVVCEDLLQVPLVGNLSRCFGKFCAQAYQKIACASDHDFSMTFCRKAISLLLSSQCCHVSCHKMQVVFWETHLPILNPPPVASLWSCQSSTSQVLWGDCRPLPVGQGMAKRCGSSRPALVQRSRRAVSGFLFKDVHLLCHTT